MLCQTCKGKTVIADKWVWIDCPVCLASGRIPDATGAKQAQPKVEKVHIPRGMNKWESRYAAEELEPHRLTGEILWYAFEPFRIRLASGAWYKPDFAVVVQEKLHGVFVPSLEFHEVKGHWREAARVRIKVAAEAVPFPFVVVTRGKTGEWQRETFKTSGLMRR